MKKIREKLPKYNAHSALNSNDEESKKNKEVYNEIANFEIGNTEKCRTYYRAQHVQCSEELKAIRNSYT